MGVCVMRLYDIKEVQNGYTLYSDKGVSLRWLVMQVDMTPEEVDALADLGVGQNYLLGETTYIYRKE
jgi:hypothetical protein